MVDLYNIVFNFGARLPGFRSRLCQPTSWELASLPFRLLTCEDGNSTHPPRVGTESPGFMLSEALSTVGLKDVFPPQLLNHANISIPSFTMRDHNSGKITVQSNPLTHVVLRGWVVWCAYPSKSVFF